jgi:hypothetical protein
VLTAVDSDKRLALLLGSLLVDDRASHAVVLVYRSWSKGDGSETHTVQSGVAEIPVVDLLGSNGFTVRGRRRRIELAGTAPAAVAAHHPFTRDPPFDYTFR